MIHISMLGSVHQDALVRLLISDGDTSTGLMAVAEPPGCPLKWLKKLVFGLSILRTYQGHWSSCSLVYNKRASQSLIFIHV